MKVRERQRVDECDAVAVEYPAKQIGQDKMQLPMIFKQVCDVRVCGKRGVGQKSDFVV